MSGWDGLGHPYGTIVADPPWHYDGAPTSTLGKGGAGQPTRRNPMPYSTMSVEEVNALDVASLAADRCHLYLWTTNRYLRDAFDVVEAWGFTPCHTLVWAKPPKGLTGGGSFTITTEFVVFGRKGTHVPAARTDTTWWSWPRTAHSVKPPAFFDVVEEISPGPYVELFARQPRLGWDSWGLGYEHAYQEIR